MQQLVDAIVPQLAPGAARTGNKVVAISRQGEKWMVAPEQGSPEEFDAVIMALPANHAGRLLERISAPLGLCGEDAVVMTGMPATVAAWASVVRLAQSTGIGTSPIFWNRPLW